MVDLFKRERLESIRDSIGVLGIYMNKVHSISDLDTSSGSIVYDALLMRLHLIGENLKILLQSNPCLFDSMKFEVSYIIGFRDMSDVYKKQTPEIIFDICTQYIPVLKIKIDTLLSNPDE